MTEAGRGFPGGCVARNGKKGCGPGENIFFFALFVFFFDFFCTFGDRGSISSEPIFHLSEVWLSPFFPRIQLYRYFWEPLSYELCRKLFLWLGHVHFMWYLPHVFGAAAMTLLIRALHRYAGGRIGIMSALALLLLFPELVWSGLYFNSSVFALFFFTLALNLLLESGQEGFRFKLFTMTAGGLAATGCFFRFDFLASVPFLLLLDASWTQNAFKKRRLLFFAAGFSALFVFWAFSGFFNVYHMVGEFRFHLAHLEMMVHQERKVTNLVCITSLPVWALLFVSLVDWLRSRAVTWKIAAIIFPLLIPPAVVVSVLSTPKYLLPYVMFLPFVPAAFFLRLKQGGKTGAAYILRGSWIVWFFLVLFVAIVPTREFPFLRLTTQPVRTITADGNRYYGGYQWMIRDRRRGVEMLATDDVLRVTHRLAEIVDAYPEDAAILVRDRRTGGPAWDRRDKSWMTGRIMGQIFLRLEQIGFRVKEHAVWDQMVLEKEGKKVRIERIMEDGVVPELPETTWLHVLPEGFGVDRKINQKVWDELEERPPVDTGEGRK